MALHRQQIDLDAQPLKVAGIVDKAGILQVARTAVACDAAGTKSEDCKFEEDREKAMGNGSFARWSEPNSLTGAKRKGAEELIARQLLSQKETPRGIAPSDNGIKVRNAYALLRDKKYEAADVAKVKSKLAGDFILDCQADGTKGFEDCKKDAGTFLKDGLKGKLSVDDSLVRSQFETFLQMKNCATECSSEVSEAVVKLGLKPKEIEARKNSAAISAAANSRADCLQKIGKIQDDCEKDGQEAFTLLSVGYDKSDYLKKLVKNLTEFKMNGIVLK